MSALSSAEQDWILSMGSGRVREFYAAVGIALPDRGGDNVDVSCFANPSAHKRDDRNASCSVSLKSGLWHCHGCGVRGNAYQAAVALGYAERRASELARAHGLFLEAVKDDAPKPRLPNERQLLKWRQELWGSEVLMGRLQELKGWTRKAIVLSGVGWDGERLTFPVRDKRFKRVGVVRYHPNPPEGVKKVKALPGTKRGLFPPPEIFRHHRNEPLFVVEGEPAAVSVRSCGLRAVAVPGTSGWRPEFAQRIWGFRNIVVLPDADAQGRDLAGRVAAAVPRARVVDLAPERDDGYDVGDIIAEASECDGMHVVRRLLERIAT